MVTISVLFVILMAASGLTLGRLTGGKSNVSVNAAFAMIVAVSLLGFAFGSMTPDGVMTIEGIKLVGGSVASLVLGWALGRITSTAGMLPGNGRILKVDRRRIVEVGVVDTVDSRRLEVPVAEKSQDQGKPQDQGQGKPQGQGQGKPQGQGQGKPQGQGQGKPQGQGQGKPQGQGQGKPQEISWTQLAERLRQERMNRQQDTRQEEGGEPVETEPAR